MKVLVDSSNKIELIEIKEIFKDNKIFKVSEIISCDTNLSECGLPNTLYKLFNEAKRKSFDLYCKKNKRDANALSIGFSFGYYEVSLVKSGAMYACVCSFYDGSEFYFGMSSSIEVSKKVLDLFERNVNEQQVLNRLSSIDKISIESNPDIVRFLTSNKHDKKEYVLQSIRAAISQIK